MVEGGLRPHWIQKTLYLKGLKNIHAKRIQKAADGNSKEGIVLDRNMFWYPMLLGCGGLAGSAFVWVVELALAYRDRRINRWAVSRETFVMWDNRLVN